MIIEQTYISVTTKSSSVNEMSCSNPITESKQEDGLTSHQVKIQLYPDADIPADSFLHPFQLIAPLSKPLQYIIRGPQQSTANKQSNSFPSCGCSFFRTGPRCAANRFPWVLGVVWPAYFQAVLHRDVWQHSNPHLLHYSCLITALVKYMVHAL